MQQSAIVFRRAFSTHLTSVVLRNPILLVSVEYATRHHTERQLAGFTFGNGPVRLEGGCADATSTLSTWASAWVV